MDTSIFRTTWVLATSAETRAVQPARNAAIPKIAHLHDKPILDRDAFVLVVRSLVREVVDCVAMAILISLRRSTGTAPNTMHHTDKLEIMSLSSIKYYLDRGSEYELYGDVYQRKQPK